MFEVSLISGTHIFLDYSENWFIGFVLSIDVLMFETSLIASTESYFYIIFGRR